MNQSWIIYSVLTIAYIVVLLVYFIRGSKSHEKELSSFLKLAHQQLDSHKKQVSHQADKKIAQAMAVVKKVQQATLLFEQQSQKEYNQIIEDAKAERRELMAKAKSEIDDLFKQADSELAEYREQRQREIEKNLVKLVIDVTEKVIDVSLSPSAHKDIIYKSLEEITQKQKRA